MKENGYEYHQEKKKKSFLKWLIELKERFRIQYSATLAVLASLTFILSEIIPPVKFFIEGNNVIPYVTFLILLDLAVAFYTQQRTPSTIVVENQDESMQELIEAVANCKKDRVDLLEFAGATTLPLIRTIKRKNINLRLLIKHPDSLSGLQKIRTITTLDTLYNSVFNNYSNSFEIRCYKLPFTLRGRRLGREILELGWLTPDIKSETAYGHGNPSILVDLTVRKNEYLLSFFCKTFDDYWNDKNTEDGLKVLDRSSTSLA